MKTAFSSRGRQFCCKHDAYAAVVFRLRERAEIFIVFVFCFPADIHLRGVFFSRFLLKRMWILC